MGDKDLPPRCSHGCQGDIVRTGAATRGSTCDQLIKEVREARLNLGKSQGACAKEAGVDRSEWTRIERGERANVPLGVASRMASAVGLDMVVNFYPADRVVRDVAHLRLLADVCALLGPDWAWRYEVPIGRPPDRRAWDLVGVHRLTGLSIRIEGETRLRDIRATHRKIEAKRVADGEPRVILAVRRSVANQLAVDAAEQMLPSAYPIRARAALAKLRAGEDPGGNALILVSWSAQSRPGR